MPRIFFNTAWQEEKKKTNCSLKHLRYQQLIRILIVKILSLKKIITNRVEGGRKCFLTARLSTRKKLRLQVMMLLHCLIAPPPHPPISPFHTSLGPSTHSLPPPPPLQPAPLTHVLSGSMPLHARLDHQGCAHLCALIICDRWGGFVLGAKPHFLLVTVLSPLIIRLFKLRGGRGVKDGQSGAVCPDTTNPEGDTSLSRGLLRQVTHRPLPCH